MENQIPLSLVKKTESLKLSLVKKNIKKITACVGSAFDVSGSMDNEYRSGLMQEFTERLMPLALTFDDNGEIDNWVFDTKSTATGPITLPNYSTFVKENIIDKRLIGGCTSFSPVLQDIYEHYFGATKKVVSTTTKKPSGFLGGIFGKKETVLTTDVQVTEGSAEGKPVYLIFQTDGENDDKGATEKLLATLEKSNIYIQFIGLGTDTTFEFIRKMGDKFNNVGFFHVPDMKHMTDETLYNALINDEFKDFMKTKFPQFIVEG